MTTYLIDQFVSSEEAKLPVSDLGLQRGYAVFDFLRTCNGVPLFIDDHLERFHRSAKQLHLNAPDNNSLKEIVYELIDRNRLDHSGIKMLLTGGNSPDGYSLAEPNLIMTEFPLQLPPPSKYRSGMKVITYEYQRQMPEIKTTNYLMGIWLQQKREQHNAGDVLYHYNGKVTEFPRSNIFIVTREDVVVTPDKNILAGITRKKVIGFAEKRFSLEVRDVTLDEVKNAAEVFFTNSSHRVFPVVQIDETEIGNGKPGVVTQKILEGFLEVEQDYINTHSTIRK